MSFNIDINTSFFQKEVITETIEQTSYEQRWVEGLNRGDNSSADNAFAADCMIHIIGSSEPTISLTDFKEMVKGILSAFPDIQFTIAVQVMEGDKVTTRWTAEGSNTGAIGEIPPTGMRNRINGLILDRVKDDKVVERWELWDQIGMMQQLVLIGQACS